MAPEEIDLDAALALLALPREMGTHPDSGEPFLARIERFGPRLRHGPTSAPPPDDGALVWLKTSHYSPFVAHHRRYASFPPDLDPEALTLEQGLALVAEAASPSAAEAGAAVGRAVVTLDAGLAFARC